MKLKSLAFLIAVLGGLGAYIYYGIQKPAEEKEASGGGDKLATGDFSKLEFVDIEIQDTKIRLEKEGNFWRLTSPIKDLASDSKVTNLVSAIQKLKKTKVIADAEKIKQGKDIAQFGLKAPKAKISYKTSDQSKLVSFTIGGQNPSFSGSYLQVNDAPDVLLATMDLDFLGTQRVDDFREMRLTTVSADQFSALEIRRAGKSITLKKVGNDWTMTSPWVLPIDPEAVKGLIEKVSLIRANSFVDKAPTTKTPDIQLIVGFAEGIADARTSAADTRPQGLQIDLFQIENPAYKPSKAKGPKAPAEAEKLITFAKGDKTPFAAISRFHFENFEKKPEDLVRKSFDDFLIGDVEKVSIKRPSSKPLELVRKAESQFEALQEKQTKSANIKNVEDILRQLRGLKALKFVDQKGSAPEKSASLRVDLDLKGGEKRSFVFELKKDIGELYHQTGPQWLRFVTAAEPVKVSSFDFDYLTKTEEK